MKVPLILLITTIACAAADVRLTDRILPLIQDGGGWKSSVTIVNLDTKAAGYELLFRSANSMHWDLKVVAPYAKIIGAYVIGQLEPGGSVTIQTTGESEQLSIGHAILYGRLWVSASNTSARAVIRAPRGIADPDTLPGYPAPSHHS